MPRFSAEYLKSLTRDIFAAQGAPAAEAATVADQLVASNVVGLDSHGVVRIPLYSRWIREGTIVPGAPMTVVSERGATAVVDCGHNFGQVGAHRAMAVAMEKARQNGVSCVVTQRCCHVGRLGYFVEMAADAGLFALGAVNSPKAGHSVVPFGGLEGRIAPNPIAYAAPGGERPVTADMAMSTTSQGKVIVYRNAGRQLPDTWLIDADGKPTTDPQALFAEPRGWIQPMGGSVGYKGFALLMLAEILAGMLAGRSMTDEVRDGSNGVCFIVIDVSAFVPEAQFRQAIDQMAAYIKSCPPAPGFDEVVLPGEIDHLHAVERMARGIPLDDTTWSQIRDTAESLQVAVPDAAIIT